ncbi:uncharacterized [Tachysurus ichikawai]
MVVCWSSIRCWLLVCRPTSLGRWCAGRPAWDAGVPADQPGTLVCRPTSLGRWCAGRPAWDAGVPADQPGTLVCRPTSLGRWCAGQHMLFFGC